MRLLPLLALLSGCIGPWPTDVAFRHVVSEPVTESDRWTADRVWVLEGIVYVQGTARLEIEAGTRIEGLPGSALIVTRDASLDARGTADLPVVFTSAAGDGRRERGDWGGLVLLGNAPTNAGITALASAPEEESRATFGGTDDVSSCGVLDHLRVSFAGEPLWGEPLPGITLAGCGSDTTVRDVQTHFTEGDGVFIAGGSPLLQRLILTRPGGAGLAWDLGWTGGGQTLIVQMEAGSGTHALSGSNQAAAPLATPRSAPLWSNVTLVGPNDAASNHRGIHLGDGTALDMRNLILTGFSAEAIDVEGTESLALLGVELTLDAAILDNSGDGGTTWSTDAEVAEWLSTTDLDIRLDVDPELPVGSRVLLAPDFVPGVGSNAAEDAAAIPQDLFDLAAFYLGAVRPGTTTPWYATWAAFPAD